MKSPTWSIGWCSESDEVSLSPSLILSVGYLVDTANGARHRIRLEAYKALRPLQKGMGGRAWSDHLQSLGLGDSAISEMVLFINNIGGFEVGRSAWSKIRQLFTRAGYFFIGTTLSIPARRFVADDRGLRRAVTHAVLPVALLSTIVMGLAWCAGLLTLAMSLSGALFIGLLWLTTIAHEYAHIALAGKQQGVVVLQRGLRIGVLHKSLSPAKELASALVGPLTGAVTAVAIGVLLSMFTGLVHGLELGFLIAAFHIYSWSPSYGDGKVIRTRIRRKVYAKNTSRFIN